MKINCEVRDTAKREGVRHWEIAARLGISEQTLVRWLRMPLPNEKTAEIIRVIAEIAAQKEGC